MLLYLAWFLGSVLVFYGTLRSSRKEQMSAMTVYMVLLGLFIGLSDMLGGYDRYIYAELFDSMANVTHTGGNPWTSYAFGFYGSEFGYGSLCAFLSYLTGNRYIFIFILTMTIYVLLIISLREYVDNAPFAVIMFMGLWVFFTFTYLRQVIGCTVIWLSVKYIISRDWKRYLLVCFIGYSFHNSAIIFLPMYFMPIKKFDREKVIWVMVAALLIGLTSIPQGLFATYGEIDAERANVSEYESDAGFRWEYLMESIFFLYLILTNYHNISKEKKDIVMLNMALMFCAILLVFIKSLNGGRLSWMFMIGVICTLSNVCVKRKQVLQYGILMIVVCLGLYYRIYNSWQGGMMGLYPYKTFLTDGYRIGDPIHDKYEYDFGYDDDKFYRPAFWIFGSDNVNGNDNE